MRKSDAFGPLQQLWLAAVLLTRLPLPHLPLAAFERGALAVWAYPVVGLIVGAAGAAAAGMATALNIPVMAAAGLALAVMMLVSGAMHEDGLADLFDGFWGGTTPARRLEIMRDSQIGTYGALALLIVVLLRWSALVTLLGAGVAPLLAASALSRGVMPAVMAILPHARDDGLSQSVGRPSFIAAGLAFGIGAAFALLCLGATGIVAILAATCVSAGIIEVAKRKICGQTGDVLGATQQLSETAILLTCAAML